MSWELLLLPLAVWRFWRLLALDNGPKCCLRRLREKLGVCYNGDYTKWTTKNGSLAEGLTCIYCSTLWWSILFTALYLWAPSWIFLLVTLPLNASATAILVERTQK